MHEESSKSNQKKHRILDDLPGVYVEEAVRVARLLNGHGGTYYFSPRFRPDRAGCAALHVCGVARILKGEGGWRLVSTRRGAAA